MARRNRNNKNNGKAPSEVRQEYDVKDSMSKISSYKSKGRNRNEYTNLTYTGNASDYGGETNGLINNDIPTFLQTQTTDNLYYRFEDKLSNYSEQNENAHDNLRQELNAVRQELDVKIDNKLPKQWYAWTIGALVVIVGVIYLLSYQEVQQLPRKVQAIETEVENIEEDIMELTKSVSTPIQE